MGINCGPDLCGSDGGKDETDGVIVKGACRALQPARQVNPHFSPDLARRAITYISSSGSADQGQAMGPNGYDRHSRGTTCR
jgi:hypothetical protein